MRAFDSWNSYLDNDGHLMHGKIRFCKKGTTDNVTIYNSSEVAIRNPEFTDMLGRTEYQVFLDGEDNVTAYFYKYIGTGNMMQWPGEDYDPTRWAYQYSSDNMDPTSSIDLSSDTANGVANMEDLRAVDPETVPSIHGVKLLWLYGYYRAGDTSPVLYYWDSASLDADDGGSTIMSNEEPGRGRWKLASREIHFDVRHFGIFPLDDKYSTDYSYTSQMANCASYLDKEGLDAWFPSLNDDASYYLLDGTNTFGIKGDIYVSDAVRFQVKSGTTGTTVVCHELHKATPFLFDSSYQNGHASLTADWVNISWVGGNCDGNARVGWVIDSASFTRVIQGKEVHFVTNGSASLQLDNCVITSNRQITGPILIQNSILKTEFFADDYDWGNLTSIGNDIRLVNCKDANTYVLLKNKQADGNYGDLGEQNLSGATLLPDSIAENASFTNVTIQGPCELHNVSGTVTVQGSDLQLNAVDCWLTVLNSSVASSINLLRGALTGVSNVTVQVLSRCYMEHATVGVPLTTLGSTAEFRACDIRQKVIATDVKLYNNQVYAEIDQRDVSGVITVLCTGNMFHDGAQHYIHSVTADTKVVGVWSHNGSSYSDRHWIRLDRTNLLYQDNDHEYTYAGNSEPYLSKWSGRNRPMQFRMFGGHWSSSAQGTGVFSTTAIPFLFYNSRTRRVTVVPRQMYWKMFTVGRGFLARSGHIQSTAITVGIAEGDYTDHTNGVVPLLWTWGCDNYRYSTMLDNKVFGTPGCVSRDGDGEATFDCSFEAANVDHTGTFSYGTEVGYMTSDDWDSGSWENTFPVYPSTPRTCTLFVFIDPDFTSGTNPQELS